jgi:MoaA/NifB/PqqE/SkfB family radical SAM enzyme
MKRVDIKTGFLCNNNCMFCAQAHNRGKGNKTTEQIKEDLSLAKKNNCTGVVFTGGETTIRKDLFEIVSYAKQLSFRSIQLQTNGRMLAYKPLCQKLINLGVNEFSPALHGHTSTIHDSLTRCKGSFDQTIKGIKNVRELDQFIVTNSVVTRKNYQYLPELAELLVKLEVNQFQMAFVHPIGNAYRYYHEIVPKMSLAAPYIHKALQIGINAGITVMAEAMPYCLMQGYEKYVSERYIPLTEIRGYDYIDLNYKNTRIREGKAKFPQCEGCRYDNVCEGPWKEYPEKFGSKEFKPIK